MFNSRLNAYGGFTLRHFVLPQNAKTPEQGIHHHNDKRRGVVGDRHGPLRHPCFVFHIRVKRNSAKSFLQLRIFRLRKFW